MVEDASLLEPDRASLPSGGSVGCATCGNPVDPLRADRVRILQERFRYFCSANCASSFDIAGLTPLPQPRRRRPSDSPFVIKTSAVSDERLEARRQIATELNSVIHEDEPGAFRGPQDTKQAPADSHDLGVSSSDGGADIGSLLLTLAM